MILQALNNQTTEWAVSTAPNRVVPRTEGFFDLDLFVEVFIEVDGITDITQHARLFFTASW